MQKKKLWKLIACIIGLIVLISIIKWIVASIVYFFSTVGRSAVLWRHSLHILVTIVLMVVVVIVSRILYRKEYMKENPVYRMQMLDKNHYFDLQISKAANYYSSYQLHQEQNKKKKISNDTISQAYAEIYAKLGHRFGAMCSYLEHFDYIANRQADADTLAGMDKELNGIENLIAQLNKLDTVNIQVETSMLDNDTERINFLIESLEELNENQ